MEERPLLDVIRRCGITGCRADAAITFANQLLVRQAFFRSKTPRDARLAMQIFRERLGQPVGQRFRQNRVVVVVLCLEVFGQFIRADPRSDRESAQIIVSSGLLRRHQIGQAVVCLPGRFQHLLTQEM